MNAFQASLYELERTQQNVKKQYVYFCYLFSVAVGTPCRCTKIILKAYLLTNMYVIHHNIDMKRRLAAFVNNWSKLELVTLLCHLDQSLPHSSRTLLNNTHSPHLQISGPLLIYLVVCALKIV